MDNKIIKIREKGDTSQISSLKILIRLIKTKGDKSGNNYPSDQKIWYKTISYGKNDKLG